ncbi:MAG: hypothetical protein D6679_07945 [Candidatus Hydrogenedentota bacterium]|nr:MAG: hypothetical protein D6679_07945 [Candidatus Hydrogenedentota bacterium]
MENMATRNKRMLLSALLFLLMLISATGGAGPAKALTPDPLAGTSGVQFLNFGRGPQIIALGESYNARVLGAAGIFGNPASISFAQDAEMMFSFNRMIADINHSLFSYVSPNMIHDRYSFALGAIYTSFGRITARDATGFELGRKQAYSAAVLATISAKYNEHFSAAVTFKGIGERIADVYGTGIAFDGGIYFRNVLIPNLDFGASVQNIGPGLTFDKESTPLTLIYGGGFSYRPPRIPLRISLDFQKPRDEKTSAMLGAEWDVRNLLYLRGGWRERSGARSHFSAGMGIRVNNVVLDYSYVRSEFLGNTHSIALRYEFWPKKHSGESKRYRTVEKAGKYVTVEESPGSRSNNSEKTEKSVSKKESTGNEKTSAPTPQKTPSEGEDLLEF